LRLAIEGKKYIYILFRFPFKTDLFITDQNRCQKVVCKGVHFFKGAWHSENLHSIYHTAFANCDSHCGQINCKIIKYFFTNAHNRLIKFE